MKAFVTGSQAYGVPRPDSDIDLAVFVTHEDAARLAEMGCESGDAEYGQTGLSLRFGRLNLLVFADPKRFRAWQEGTEELKARKPVTRQEAKIHLITKASLA